nr:hypothetical protein [Actinomadura barringtoniae]
MIILSGVLVVVAIALLVAGIVAGNGDSAQVFGLDALVVIYVSIAVSIVSALCLAIGVFLRRKELFGGGATPTQARKPKKGKKAAPAKAKAPVPKDAPEPVDDEVQIPAPPANVPDDAPVFVVRGRKRYHLDTCRQLAGRDKEELTYAEAKEEGFSPCTACLPDTALAARAAVSVPAAAGDKKGLAGLAKPGPASDTAKTAELPRTPPAKPGPAKPGPAKPGPAKPGPAKPSLDKPSLDKPSLDKPSLDKPSLDKPSLDKPSLDKPSLDKPSLDKPAGQASAASSALPSSPPAQPVKAEPASPPVTPNPVTPKPAAPASDALGDIASAAAKPAAAKSAQAQSAPAKEAPKASEPVDDPERATGPLPSAWGAPTPPVAPAAKPGPETPKAPKADPTVTDLPLAAAAKKAAAANSDPEPSSAAAPRPRQPEDTKPPAADSDDEGPQVRILSGTKRYHRTDCALIEDIGDEADDLEALSRAEAKARGCTPCLVCQPDKEHARD